MPHRAPGTIAPPSHPHRAPGKIAPPSHPLRRLLLCVAPAIHHRLLVCASNPSPFAGHLRPYSSPIGTQRRVSLPWWLVFLPLRTPWRDILDLIYLAGASRPKPSTRNTEVPALPSHAASVSPTRRTDLVSTPVLPAIQQQASQEDLPTPVSTPESKEPKEPTGGVRETKKKASKKKDTESALPAAGNDDGEQLLPTRFRPLCLPSRARYLFFCLTTPVCFSATCAHARCTMIADACASVHVQHRCCCHQPFFRIPHQHHNTATVLRATIHLPYSSLHAHCPQALRRGALWILQLHSPPT